MKKFITPIAAVFAVASLVLMGLTANVDAASPSTAPGHNKLQCFDGTTDGGFNGTCTLQGNGARGPATLNNNDGDSDPFNNYSGVFVLNSTVYGQAVGDITQLQFSYAGDAATAGSPRFSIPIDTNGDDATDFFAFVSAFHCNDGAGLVDVINDSSCTIFAGTESFDNWAALVEAHPDWTIATDNFIFIIADDPGQWTIGGVKFGAVK
jgi:hypothetical protein